ncbi:MAG TPA: hypothetical protein VMZ50_11475, partial [Phycisphaerae bacterium]|nr:hypothetical protein [Phycisphaerae bacterium]
MRAAVGRVRWAEAELDGEIYRRIAAGLPVHVGVAACDTSSEAARLPASKELADGRKRDRIIDTVHDGPATADRSSPAAAGRGAEAIREIPTCNTADCASRSSGSSKLWEKAMNRMHRRSPAITFAALFATVALAGCSDEQNSSSTAPAPAGPPPRRAALVGDLAVFYDLQITQTTGTGTGNSPVKATA